MKRVVKKLFAIMSAAVMLTSNVAELSAVFAPSLYVNQDITVYDGSVDDHESSKAAPLGTYVIGDEKDETKKLFELNFLAPDGSKAEEYYNGGDSHDAINLPTEFPSDWKFTLNQDEKQPHYYWASATDSSKFPQFVSETNGYNESLNFPEYFEVWVPITADDKADDEKITGGYQRIRYQFKNVTVDEVPVTFIGAIEFNDNYYFYYSTASEGTNSTVGVTAINVKDNSSGIIADEDVRKFTVNYEQAPYNIYYSVKVPDPEKDDEYYVIYKDLIQKEDKDHNLTTLEYDADLKVGGIEVSKWLDKVFGANRVSNLVHDGSYSFSVTTPVEYTAEVFRYFRYDKAYGTGAEASVMRPNYAQVTRHRNYPIGTEPVYERNGDTINPNKDKGPTAFSLTATFPADNVTEDRLIQAVLTERTYTPMFDATMWLKTANAGGEQDTNARGTTGAGFGQDYSAVPGNILPESGKGDGPWNWGSFKTNKKEMTEDGDGYTIDWYFQTNDKDKAYFMDSFELNGVGLTVPFYPTQNYKSNTEIPEKERDGKSVTYTTLPGGAVARLEFYREFGSTEKLTQRVYRLTITNAKTNVTVTGGNLMMFNGGAPEISVYSLKGTYLDGEYIDGGDEDTRYLNYIQAFVNGKWVSQKLAKVIIEQNTDFTFATDNGKGNIRFKLLPSYEDPEYTFKPYEDGKEPLQSGSLTDGDKITKDDDGWYYITLKDNGKGENPDGVRFALLTITATPAKYTIEYLPNGDYSEDIVATDEEKKELVGNPIKWDPDSVMADVTSYEEEDDEGNKKLDEDGNPIIHYYDSNRIDLGDRLVDQMYDRDVYNTVTVIHNVPVDLNGKMKFVGWKIVKDVKDYPNKSDNTPKKDGKYEGADSAEGQPQYLNAGQGIELDKIFEYWCGEHPITDGSRRYVIKLEAVWEPIPAVETEDITYEIYVRRVTSDGEVISQDERLAREAAVIIKNDDENFNATASVFIDINSGEVLDWLKKNPTYSVYKNGTEKSVLFGTVSKNNSKELENGVASIANVLPQNRFYVAVVEDRGPLTFDIAKGDNDECDDKTFDVVIKAPRDKVTSGMFFKYSETAEDSMLMEGIKPDEIDAYTFDGDELKINGLKPGEEVTIYVLAGDGYYITETYGTGKDTDDKYNIRVAKTVKGTVENDKLAESKGANKVEAAVSVSPDSHSNSDDKLLISSPTHYVIYNTLVPTTLSVKKMQAKVVNGVVGTKTDARLDVTPGDIVEYTVTVSNTNENRAHDTITIADMIPEGTELVGGFTASRGTANKDGSGKIITWSFKKLDKSASETLTYRVKVSATTEKEKERSSTAQVDKGSKGYYYVNEITNYDGSPSETVLNVLTGTLTLCKTINSVNGVEIDKDQEFEIKITLAGFPDTITKTNGVLNSKLTFDTVKTTSAGDVNGTLAFEPTLGGAIWTATVNLKHGEKIKIKGLSIGVNYEIEEINIPKNYKLDKYEDNASGEIKGDENVAVYNDRKTGELDITKTVTRSDGLEVDEEEDFTFTLTLTEADGITPITCALTKDVNGESTSLTANGGTYTFTIKHGKTIKIKGIPADAKYTVEENLTTEQEKIYVKTVSPESGTVGADSIVVVGATNQRFTGELEIEKEVTGSGGDKNKRFEFTVYLYEADGTTKLTGSYEYIFTPAPSTAATQALDAPAAIAATKNPTVKSGGKVELRHGEKITIVGLPVGAKYKIVETAEDGYTSTVTVNGTVTDKAEGSIPNGKETVKFTNAKGTGKLKLSKTVTTTFGEDQTKEFKFTVTLKDDDGNTLTGITGYYNTLVNDSTSGKVLFDEGVATVKLKHNETVEITGLPVGAHYIVQEESDDNYKVSSTGATGEIVNNDDGDVTKIAFTNTRKTSGLEIKKNIVHTDDTAPSDAEMDIDFEFTLTLEEANGTAITNDLTKVVNGTSTVLTATDNSYTFTIKHGETIQITGIPAGAKYTVAENLTTAQAAEYVSTLSNATGIAGTGGSISVSAENKKTIVHEGNLEVTKTVAYSDASDVRDEDKAKEFTFTLTLTKDDEVCEDIDGTYGDITFNKGVANFTLKHGETKTATGLPAGISYKVVETEVDGYTISYGSTADNAVGTIPDGGETAEVTVTNTKATGKLTVNKTVKHSDNSALDVADTDRDFTIIVTLSDNTINGVYGGMAFINGVAVFTIKHDGTKTAAGLPEGITYSVVETKYDGYAASYSYSNSGKKIVANKTALVEVTNTKTISKTGSLAVSKTVDHSDNSALSAADMNMEFSFKVTLTDKDGKTLTNITGTYGDMEFKSGVAEFTLRHGESKIATGIPEGATYTVSEETVGGFETTSSGETGDIEDGVTATAEFTNTKQTGGLRVSKEIDGDIADPNQRFIFTVKLYDSEGGNVLEDFRGTGMGFVKGVAEFTLSGGEFKEAAGIPAGTYYTVVESNNEGYTVSSTGETGTITKNETAQAEFVNTKNAVKTGDLKISKTVQHTAASEDDSDLDDADKNKVFTFTVTIYEADGETVCEGIDGTYGDIVFSRGVSTVTLKHGEAKTAEGLPEKLVYAVVESDDSDYTLTDKFGDTGAIAGGDTVTAKFTNTRKTGGLTVTKNVKHSDGSAIDDTEAKEVFTITVTLSDTSINGKFGGMTFKNGEATLNLSDGESATAAGLPFGITYTVEETDSKDYTVSYENETGTIAVGITAEATVTNTKSITTEGNLKITKTVAYSDGRAVRDEDKTKEFTFTLTLKKDNKICEDIDGTYGDMVFGKGVANFTLTDGETKVAKGLPAGITYTVVETAADGYTVSYKGNVSSGTITAGKTDEISVTNTKSVGDLTVSKTVAHSDDSELDAAEKEIPFAFTVTLSDSSVNGAYGNMTFNNGVAKFSLKHGDHMTATGLPTGTMYVVTEDANGEYTVTSTGRVGTIAKKNGTGAAQAVAAFTNTKEADDENDAISDLTVENLVSGGSTTKSFRFTLTLKDAEGNGIATPLTIKMGDGDEQTLEAGADGTYSFDLKHGDIITFIGLPVGTKYAIVEEEDDNYIVRKSGYNGEIADGSNTAVFVYVVKRGSLTVSKTVTGTAGDTDKEFTFTVMVYEDSNKTPYTAVNGTYGDMTFEKGVATFTLKHGEHKTASALPSGAVYEVVETGNEGYTVTKTGYTGIISEKTNASANFVNNKEGEVGKLTVSNTVTGNGGDTNKKFKFTITLYKDAAKTAIYEDVDGTYGNITFGMGVATVELAHSESVTAIGLPAGITYTVVESDNEGYDVTVTGDEGTIPVNDEAKAVFINNKDEEPVPETWNLSVKKTITNENPDTNKYFTFKTRLYKDADRTVPYELNGFFGDMAFINGVATFTLKHSDTKTAIGLPVKTEDGLTVYYSVSEVPSSGYNTTTPKSSTGKAAKDGNVVVEIKNTKIEESEEKLGNLIVSKTVSGTAQHDINEEFGFMVVLSDASVSGIRGDMYFTNGVAEFTLKANEHKTAIGLPAGITYTVTETDSKDYTPSVESKTGKIHENKDEQVRFNNHKDEDIVSDPGTGSLIVTMFVEGTAPYFGNEFTAIVTLYGEDGVTVLEDINATYGNMTFVNGVATLKLAHNGSAYAIGLPAGTRYTVVETDGQGYEVTYNGKVAANVSGVIIADDTVEVVITNTKDADPEPEPKFGGLSVTKTVVHADGSGLDDGEDQKAFSFTVTIYEDEANTIVYKGVDGTFGNMLFGEGVATFTLTHGQSVIAAGLPVGLYYTVEEDNYEGYTSESVLAAGTIKDDGTVVAVKYTNIKEEEPAPELGSLKVTMQVMGTAEHDPDEEFKFRVELRDTSVNYLGSWALFSEQLGIEPRDTSLNGLYGDMYFNNGVAEFTLKAGESKVATDLPAGLTFIITETDSKGYGVTNNNATVTIVKDDTVEVVVTNTMDKEPDPEVKLGSLKVTNTVTGTAGETDKEFTFTVKLDDETINGKHGDMEFTKGVATFTLKHGEFKTATDLPDGTGYTVTESDNEGYTVTNSGDTGKIVADDTVIAAFTNQKDAAVIQTGDLIVTNTVSGNAANYYQAFSFTVILSDSTVNGIYGQMTFENGVAFFGLMHGQSIIAKGLPAGISYTVIENNSADYIVSSVGEIGTIIANGTRTAKFTNIRNTAWTPTPTVPQIPSTEPEKPEEPKEPEIIVDMPVEPGETDEEVSGEEDKHAEVDTASVVADELEDSNPHTGPQSSALFAVSIAMLAAIAVVTVRRRCR